MKNKYLSIITILMLTLGVQAQERFSKQQLISDADSLYAAIYEIHPDMFAEYPKVLFMEELNSIKETFKDSMTIFDQYKSIAPLISKLGDGHTSVSIPYNALKEINAKILPFDVDIDKSDYSIYLSKDYSTTQSEILPNETILSINGRSCSELVKDMLRYKSGEKESFKIELLKNRFAPLLYVLNEDSVFDIEYMGEKNIPSSTTIHGIPYSEWDAQKKQNRPDNDTYYSMSIDSKNKIAIIDFRSFSDLSRFEVFLDSAFNEIKQQKINDLIIDIRKNGGGNSALGDELFQYISHVPFSQFGKVTIKISDRLKQKHNKDDKDFDVPNGIETFETDKLIALRDNKLRYTGNIYLLTSNYTFSSATDFAWTFQYFKTGTIIGEETGGLIVCFGDILGQTLLNTKLKFGVSWKKFYGYGATDDNIHPVEPDHEIAAEQAMDYAIDLIKKKRE